MLTRSLATVAVFAAVASAAVAPAVAFAVPSSVAAADEAAAAASAQQTQEDDGAVPAESDATREDADLMQAPSGVAAQPEADAGEGVAVLSDDGIAPAAAPRMVSREYYDGKYWYYYNDKGAMVKDDFVKLKDAAAPGGEKWVYYDASGHMLYGEQYINGGWYYLNPYTGAVTYDFVLLSDPGVAGGKKWVYYGPYMADGRMRYGEQLVNGGWYYMQPGSGAVAYDFVLLEDKSAEGGKKWVYYGPYMGDGRMRYGEQYINGGWYYLTPGTGAVDYEWALIPTSNGGTKWVYYGPYMGDGRMRYGTQVIDGVRCTFNNYTGQYTGSMSVLQKLLSYSKTSYSYSLSKLVDLHMGVSAGADRNTILKYANPANFPADSAGYYMFADLRTDTGLSGAQIDAFIATKGATGALANCGTIIKAAAKEYGLNEMYLTAHMIFETGWGSSALSKGRQLEERVINGKTYPAGYYYNFVGYGAYDSDPTNAGFLYAQEHGWNSKAAAIYGAAKEISENYVNNTTYGPQYTLYNMRWNPWYIQQHGVRCWHEYATAAHWAYGIAEYMYDGYEYLNYSPTLRYYVPVFSN